MIKEDGNEGFEHLPDNILSQGVDFLRKYFVTVNKKGICNNGEMVVKY